MPDYQYVWEGSKKYPQRFAGYRKIPGTSCAEAHGFRAKVFGRDLGRFLTELHNVHPSRKILELVPRYNPKAWAKSRTAFYRRTRKLVYPLLDSRTCEIAEDFWAHSIDELSRADFHPTLIHSDLRAGNMILDPITSRLNGIIDWDNTAIADPALDFMGAFELSHRLGTEALENYGRDRSGYVNRANIYLKTVPFGEIAWGIRTGTRRFVKDGLRHMDRIFRSS